MKCPKHPRYQALRVPNADCLTCRRIYAKKTAVDIDSCKEALERIVVDALVVDHAPHLLTASRVKGMRGLYYDTNRSELKAALLRAYRMGREDAGG